MLHPLVAAHHPLPVLTGVAKGHGAALWVLHRGARSWDAVAFQFYPNYTPRAHMSLPSRSRPAGVAKGHGDTIWLLHRGAKPWDAATFFSGGRAEHISDPAPVRGPVVLQLKQVNVYALQLSHTSTGMNQKPIEDTYQTSWIFRLAANIAALNSFCLLCRTRERWCARGATASWSCRTAWQ